MKKSYVTMAFKICPICEAKIDAGLLLDKRLKDTFEKETFTGFEVCEKCKKDGYVPLIVIDEEKSTVNEHGNITPQGAWKTGEVAYMKNEVFKKNFNDKTPPFAYISHKAFIQIQN